jgi:hypothetical protein
VTPTTNAERFSRLRLAIVRLAETTAANATRGFGRGDDPPAQPDKATQLASEIREDLQQLEQIVRAADDVLHANTANAKHAARQDLHVRLSRWRGWPEPETPA